MPRHYPCWRRSSAGFAAFVFGSELSFRLLEERSQSCLFSGICRRRKPQSVQLPLNLYPFGQTFAALFGLDYFCVVVDVNNHPWRWTVILLLSFYFGTKRNRPEKSVAPRGDVLTPFCLWIVIPWSLRHYNGFAIHWSVLPGIETCLLKNFAWARTPKEEFCFPISPTPDRCPPTVPSGLSIVGTIENQEE